MKFEIYLIFLVKLFLQHEQKIIKKKKLNILRTKRAFKINDHLSSFLKGFNEANKTKKFFWKVRL